MTKRSKSFYVALFCFLRDKFAINPSNTMSDYEKAPRLAAQNVWVDVDVNGCLFHYTQALYRRAKKLPLLRSALRYRRGDTVSKNIMKMYLRLPLVPVDNIEVAFEEIKRHTSNMGLEATFRQFEE